MVEIPAQLRKRGLDAFEYEAVHGVRIGEVEARKLGFNARAYDVQLSLHGPYFVNLSGERATVEASKKRILDSLRAAKWMGARQAVFHPGYVGKRSRQESLEMCVRAMREIVQEANFMGISGIFLGPETTGKPVQVGSLEEILVLCEQVETTRPTIDWAHLHARDGGRLGSKGDYLKVTDLIEKRLGSEALKTLHCHYAHVEFTAKGERMHHTMEEAEYGPDFLPLAEIIVEQGLSPTIISESPLLDLDSLKMRDIVACVAASKKGS